jgi:hypothetical protein
VITNQTSAGGSKPLNPQKNPRRRPVAGRRPRAGQSHSTAATSRRAVPGSRCAVWNLFVLPPWIGSATAAPRRWLAPTEETLRNFRIDHEIKGAGAMPMRGREVHRPRRADATDADDACVSFARPRASFPARPPSSPARLQTTAPSRRPGGRRRVCRLPRCCCETDKQSLASAVPAARSALYYY